jgi:hypothetical protein
MNCLICSGKMEPFLKRDPKKYAYGNLVKDIECYKYSKCTNCGFVFLDTIKELSPQRWERLNHDFHTFIENNPAPTNQPPYLEQATFINTLAKYNIIDMNSSLDYAGGYGTLSKILEQVFKLNLSVYDPYVTESSFKKYINLCEEDKFKFITNSALFEHLTDREGLLDILKPLDKVNGALMIHTVICENIPNDPAWFYYLPPVHCAFHTNKSMNILMNEFGFESSLYCPSAKSWMLFKQHEPSLEMALNKINNLFQTNYCYYQKGTFVDYWKGFKNLK